MHHAQQLADKFGCVAVLKGSGTVIAAPGQTPIINPTGNTRLSTAGTGDLLAGMLGGTWSARAASMDNTAKSLQELTSQVVYAHGALAENAPPHITTASDFAKRITRSV